MVRPLRDDGPGRGPAEYGAILGFVAVPCVAAIVFTSARLLAHLHGISASFP